MAMVDLHYYISDSLLEGRVGGKSFCFFAFSGSGRGRKEGFREKELVSMLAHNLWEYRRKTDKKHEVRGGPLPPGVYKIEKPVANYISLGVSFGRAAVLKATGSSKTFERDGFLIHGRGKEGSDGCLVPRKPTDLHALLDALEATGGGTLQVHFFREAKLKQSSLV
jgi:hypothetical protein